MRKTLINFALLLFAMPAFALPEDGLVYQLKASVVKIRVILPNGHYGVGSGVVVAKDQVVTNCHVVAKAAAINVIKFGESFRASSIKADWQHDICIVRFDGLNTEVAQIGSSKIPVSYTHLDVYKRQGTPAILIGAPLLEPRWVKVIPSRREAFSASSKNNS